MPRNRNPADTVIGQRVRAQRLAQRVTQSELADELGVTFQQVQKYENGNNRISGASLVVIAAFLKTTPHALLGLNGVPKDDDLWNVLANKHVNAAVRRMRNATSAQRKLLAEIMESAMNTAKIAKLRT